MNQKDFFSNNRYIFLPSLRHPKVALVIDNRELAKKAFNLYNPFSKKAQFLKNFFYFLFIYFNGFSIIFWRSITQKKSNFIRYLETLLSTSLVSSLYLSTIDDKVVMQLQTLDAKIVGYLKYPLNKIGLQHLENEKKAIEILSKNNIVNKYILHDKFDGKPFLLLEALEGEIGLIDRHYLDRLLLIFKREEVYSLVEHPRIIELKKEVVEIGLASFSPQIKKVCDNSNMQYALVYEHGDFTPWNIVNVDGGYVPFDFEHFVEDGLEYFDLIKYYYQVGKLLNQLKAPALIAFISEQIAVQEINELLQLFLIKEIVRNKEENESYKFEASMLDVMDK